MPAARVRKPRILTENKGEGGEVWGVGRGYEAGDWNRVT